MPHVLAGDIGGTNARFAIFEVTKKGPRLAHSEVLDSRAYKTFESAMGTFLKNAKSTKLAAASLAIAGPVVEQRVKTTNLPWLVDARTITKKFSIKKVTLLNDLMAVGLEVESEAGRDVDFVFDDEQTGHGGQAPPGFT